MDPLGLPGPQFLVFYAAFGAGLFWLAGWIIRRRESLPEVPRLDLSDPYEIAMLRGDANEAMRVAAISLVDRNLLKVEGDRLVAKEGAETHVRRPIEKAVLQHFSVPKVAHEMYHSYLVKKSCLAYRRDLREKNLLAGPDHHAYRLPILLAALAAAVSVTWVKVGMAIDRGRPFEFLILLTLLLAVVLLRMLAKRRTALGDRILEDLKSLFQQLKTRAHLLRRGGDTNEVALLMAIFGISALPAGHDYAKLLFPKAARNDKGGGWTSSCSAGCGSTSGGCGSGGGGGCGGCGGGGD